MNMDERRKTWEAKRAAMAPKPEEPKQPIRGVGDVLAVVFDPVAKVLGIDKKNCGCAKRQEWLNQKLPFGKGDA